MNFLFSGFYLFEIYDFRIDLGYFFDLGLLNGLWLKNKNDFNLNPDNNSQKINNFNNQYFKN